ncbi:hypothetical protein M422DRAFT_783244 [Sphaerobolus stellatus SS14]|uniref:Reverse transcriptase domain-containing protein n=1 Tax=Sphaerobolus stellatus (strain SS14) TaxID=990650 RepID=A0A0C9UE90_SPHS4|nr:hypothetical protein M422DRAFT_783244 [Sphaerobolus stellatus SS14]
MQRLGAGGPLRMLYNSMSFVVHANAELSELFSSSLSVLQEDLSSPVLYLLYCHDFILLGDPDDALLNGYAISHLKHANNMVIISTFLRGLQRYLDYLTAWCGRNFMTINAMKSKYNIFGPLPSPLPLPILENIALCKETRHCYACCQYNPVPLKACLRHPNNNEKEVVLRMRRPTSPEYRPGTAIVITYLVRSKLLKPQHLPMSRWYVLPPDKLILLQQREERDRDSKPLHRTMALRDHLLVTSLSIALPSRDYSSPTPQNAVEQHTTQRPPLPLLPPPSDTSSPPSRGHFHASRTSTTTRAHTPTPPPHPPSLPDRPTLPCPPSLPCLEGV